jgi:hypothetical protein
VIVSAAICPCPPLLAAELTGQAQVLPDLRAACAAAVSRLAAAGPDVLVVAGPGEATAAWPADSRLDAAVYAPALGNAGRGAGTRPGGDAGPGGAPALPLSLGIGARLLDEAGYSGPRAFHAIGALAPPAACLRLGEQIAASAPRVALLAMGDGSARRSVSAPGYLDERAAPFDEAVEHAVRDADRAALAALDPALAADLMAGGRPAWQVLAGALAGRLVTEILYSGAPLGVGYLVATVAPR